MKHDKMNSWISTTQLQNKNAGDTIASTQEVHTYPVSSPLILQMNPYIVHHLFCLFVYFNKNMCTASFFPSQYYVS